MRTHAAVPFAVNQGGDRFRIFFSARDSANRAQTGHFDIDLKDPFRALSISSEPVLKLGRPGHFDDSGAMLSWLTEQGGAIYAYYIGWNTGTTVPFRNSIGLAISRDDGLTFSRYSDGPILDRSIHDPCFAANPCVLVESGCWRMWYLSCVDWELWNGILRHKYHIKYAESADGIEWVRSGITCIDFRTAAEYAISRPCVIKDGGTYRMWYSFRGEAYRIGYAESDDGIAWRRRDEEAGIEVSENGWDSTMIEYPYVFDHGGRRYMLYNGNEYGKTGIGLAVND